VGIEGDHDRVTSLDQFASTYLRARWYLGLGLVVLTLVIWAADLGHPFLWVVALAGIVIIAHAYAMTVWDINDTTYALVVDGSAVHGAVLIFASANGDRAAPLLTIVGSVVLIGLFASGWRRIALTAYSTTFGLVTLTVVAHGDLTLVLIDLLSMILVEGIVLGIIVAVRSRLDEMEVIRAETLGVVSHELRNFLTGVVGVTELLRDDAGGLSSVEISELLQMANEQATEAGEVIEDLLVASRAERGVLDTLPEPVDLGPITKTMIRRVADHEKEIELLPLDSPAWAMVDPLRYGQILRNLLTNAERYGGPMVTVSVETLGDTVSVVVADNGTGVPPADAALIFQPYHRASDRAPAPGSTGLGLWISRSLAHRMSGSLTYRRHDGQTLFELLIPAASEPIYPNGEMLGEPRVSI
jgi:signal transduction histidine kinase